MNFQTSAVPASAVSAPDQEQKGLNDMKLSFIFYMIGGGFALIPVVGGFGGLLVLVALLFFVIGWRALGRSTLAEASRYRSTGDWFIYSIVIVIVVAVIGSLVIAIYLIGSFITYLGQSPNPQTLYQSAFFRSFLGYIFAMVAVAALVWVLPWYKASASMAKLAVEVSQPRLRTAGRLLLLNAVIGVVIELVLAAFFYSGFVSINIPTTGSGIGQSYGAYFTPFTGTGYVEYYLISLISSVILVLAAYEGYSGVKGAIRP
jgi:hypothetical protein